MVSVRVSEKTSSQALEAPLSSHMKLERDGANLKVTWSFPSSEKIKTVFVAVRQYKGGLAYRPVEYEDDHATLAEDDYFKPPVKECFGFDVETSSIFVEGLEPDYEYGAIINVRNEDGELSGWSDRSDDHAIILDVPRPPIPTIQPKLVLKNKDTASVEWSFPSTAEVGREQGATIVKTYVELSGGSWETFMRGEREWIPVEEIAGNKGSFTFPTTAVGSDVSKVVDDNLPQQNFRGEGGRDQWRDPKGLFSKTGIPVPESKILVTGLKGYEGSQGSDDYWARFSFENAYGRRSYWSPASNTDKIPTHKSACCRLKNKIRFFWKWMEEQKCSKRYPPYPADNGARWKKAEIVDIPPEKCK